jgi:hypothetical protein
MCKEEPHSTYLMVSAKILTFPATDNRRIHSGLRIITEKNTCLILGVKFQKRRSSFRGRGGEMRVSGYISSLNE